MSDWVVKGRSSVVKVYTDGKMSVVVDEKDGRLNLVAKVIALENGIRVIADNVEITVNTESKQVEVN